MDDETRKAYLGVFLEESNNLIEQFEALASELEKGCVTEPNIVAFRLVHTMKGNALAMGYDEIVQACHLFEDKLQRKVEQSEPVSNLDLSNLVADLKIQLESIQAGCCADAEPSFEMEGSAEKHRTIRIAAESVTKLATLTEESAFWIWPELYLPESGHRALNFARDLNNIAIGLCAAELSPTFDRIGHTIRDLQNRLGKRVTFKTEGGELLVDRFAIDAVTDPLNHIARNAFDHGIEVASFRRQNGKQEIGSISISAKQIDGFLRIEVSDDGAGIDVNKLRRKAVSRGILSTEEAAALTDDEAVNLIFESGLTTAESVSDISGRGVGMDIVQSNLASAGGTIRVETEIGKGSRMILDIPTQIVVDEHLVCVAGANYFYLPHDDVLEAFSATKLMQRSARKSAQIQIANKRIKVFKYAHKKWIPATDNNSWDDSFIVVLRSSGGRRAILVDQVIGRVRRLAIPGRRIASLDPETIFKLAA